MTPPLAAFASELINAETTVLSRWYSAKAKSAAICEVSTLLALATVVFGQDVCVNPKTFVLKP